MEKISYREFGRRVGRSDTTIRKAVESGVISAASVTYRPSGVPQLLWESAKADWDNNGGGMQGDAKGLSPTSNYVKKNPGEQPTAPQPPEEKPPPVQPTPGNIKPQISIEDAQAKSSIWDSKRVREKTAAAREVLEFQVFQKSLAKVDDVYKALFDYGQMLRNSFIAIPDRVIDQVRAAKDRNEGHAILLKEIEAVLEKLSTPPTVTD